MYMYTGFDLNKTPRGREFELRSGHIYSKVFGDEIISTAILSLTLVQVEQLSVMAKVWTL